MRASAGAMCQTNQITGPSPKRVTCWARYYHGEIDCAVSGGAPARSEAAGAIFFSRTGSSRQSLALSLHRGLLARIIRP